MVKMCIHYLILLFTVRLVIIVVEFFCVTNISNGSDTKQLLCSTIL